MFGLERVFSMFWVKGRQFHPPPLALKFWFGFSPFSRSGRQGRAPTTSFAPSQPLDFRTEHHGAAGLCVGLTRGGRICAWVLTEGLGGYGPKGRDRKRAEGLR